VFGYEIGRAGLNVADLDGDGRQEIVVQAVQAHFYTGHFWYVLQHEQGLYVHRWTGVERSGRITALSTVDINEDGASEVVLLVGNEIEVYRGVPPVLQLSIPVDGEGGDYVGLSVADVDADGVLEAVFSNDIRDELFIYELMFGAREFFDPDLGGSVTAVGNVDRDPEVEIVVGKRFGAGYVLDGKTWRIEWTEPQGFGDRLQLGDVDADGMDEILAAHAQGSVRAFDADLQSVAWTAEGNTSTAALLVADVDPGDVPEVIIADDRSLNISIHNGRTGAQKRFIRDPVNHGFGLLAAGDVDGDGMVELIWGGVGSTASDFLFVADVASLQVEWRSEDYAGPFHALDHGDLDGDGRPELLFGAFASGSFSGAGRYFVHDAVTKRPEYQGPETTSSDRAGLWRVRHANVDADPQAELFVTTGDSAAQLVCFDGATQAEQWKLVAQIGGQFQSLAVADVDQDGDLEAAAAVDGAVLFVYDAASGRREWFVEAGGSHPTLLRVAQVDGDPALELVVGNTSSGVLFVVDAATRTVQLETRQHKVTALETPDRDGDGTAEILVGTRDGQILRLDAQTGQPIEDLGSFSVDPLAFNAIQGLAVVDLRVYPKILMPPRGTGTPSEVTVRVYVTSSGYC
jgi:outer membrane protein assembly factor BamB